ncbi:hypothetical protein [Saccharospirillum impatiens]|uniref:hypothetical protein n=1 Tax=Saccharospirillum impatiens TaxID=169438 RepID=UPI0003F83B42|nr:hypothetical protein [Saccharospirillum impatiens]
MAISPLIPVSSTGANQNVSGQGTAVGSTTLPTQTAQAESATETSDDSASFSSRAERLAALNEEFTITGPDFEVSAAFISRLQEFEFISPGEAEGLLGQSAPGAEPAVKDAGPQAIIDLQQDLEALAGTVPEDGNLALLLNETSAALTDLKASSPLANAPQYKALQQRLEQSLASDPDAAALSDADRYRMTQAMDVMLIASRLAPGSETNAGIRSYLANT